MSQWVINLVMWRGNLCRALNWKRFCSVTFFILLFIFRVETFCFKFKDYDSEKKNGSRIMWIFKSQICRPQCCYGSCRTLFTFLQITIIQIYLPVRLLYIFPSLTPVDTRGLSQKQMHLIPGRHSDIPWCFWQTHLTPCCFLGCIPLQSHYRSFFIK